MRFVINDTIPKQFNTKGDIFLIADYTNGSWIKHNPNCEAWVGFSEKTVDISWKILQEFSIVKR